MNVPYFLNYFIDFYRLFVGIGQALTPIWGMSQRLPRRVGTATAKRLMFTCATVGAADALSIGLVEAVYPLDEFYQ